MASTNHCFPFHEFFTCLQIQNCCNQPTVGIHAEGDLQPWFTIVKLMSRIEITKGWIVIIQRNYYLFIRFIFC